MADKYYQTVKLEHGTDITISLLDKDVQVVELEDLCLFGVEIEKPWTLPTQMVEAIIAQALDYACDQSWEKQDD